jgi:hypothetical protein
MVYLKNASASEMGPAHELTDSMELSPYWEITSCTALQEFSNNLWNKKFHYHVHKSLSILGQIKPVHTTLSSIPKIHFNVILPQCTINND